VERLASLLREGPRFALVEQVESTWLPATGIDHDFRVLH
jgi:hypothetical protein